MILADGRIGVRGNLDEVEAVFTGQRDRFLDGNGAAVEAGVIDELNFFGADVFVGARAVFLDRRGSSHRAANGRLLLLPLIRCLHRDGNPAKQSRRIEINAVEVNGYKHG